MHRLPTRIVLAALFVALTTPALAAVCTQPKLFQAPASIDFQDRPNRVALADFNHDGIPDVAVGLTDTYFQTPGQYVAILLGRGSGGTGDGTFAPPSLASVGLMPEGIAAADLDGDGNPDLVVADWAGNSISILRGHGDGTFAPRDSIPCANHPHGLLVADLNHDGVPDLAVANNGAPTLSVLIGQGGGTFSPPVPYPVGDLPVNLAVGDVDGDGKPDLVATAFNHGMAVLIGNGDGTFQAARDFPTGGQPYVLALADLDGDGHLDALAGNQGSSGLAVLKGDGAGGFGAPTLYGNGAWSVGAIATGDVNGDGIADVALTDATGGNVVLLLGQGSGGVGNGVFAVQSEYAATGFPMGLAMRDLNGDGLADLVVGNYGAGAAQVMLGVCAVPPELPHLVSVRDVANDHGRAVFVRWTRSSLDVAGSGSVSGYRVWRRLPPQLAAAAARPGAMVAASSASPLGWLRRVATPDGTRVDFWEAVASLPAEGLAGYGFTATVTQDSMADSNPFTAFFVTALTANPAVFYESNVDSGYAVDNLPPSPPGAFAALPAPGGTRLHWLPNAEPDFAAYHLYRGGSPDFATSPATRIAVLADTGYVDAPGGACFYKLTAANRSGFESSSSASSTPGSAAVGGGEPPAEVFLAATRPSPARVAATLRFGLPRDADVSLAVYDVNGRLVRELAGGRMAAGSRELEWDLRDSAGRPVSGGLYFIRLDAGGIARAGRVVVAR